MITSSKIPLLFFTICVLLSVISAKAQFGIKAGAGVSDIIFAVGGQSPYLGYEVDHLTHNYPLFSYQLGFFGVIDLNKHFEFQPELQFARQGINYDINFQYDEIVYRLYIWYMNLPFLFRYKMKLKKQSHPILLLGPYASLKLKGTKITEYDGQQTVENINNLKDFDFGLTFGFGYDFDLSRGGNLMTDLRCNYGLMNMMGFIEGHIPDHNGPKNAKARNISLMLMIGYRFANFPKKEHAK